MNAFNGEVRFSSVIYLLAFAAKSHQNNTRLVCIRDVNAQISDLLLQFELVKKNGNHNIGNEFFCQMI